MMLMLLLGGVWSFGAYVVTARYWFDPTSVWVIDTQKGQSVYMNVERVVKRDFNGSYTATVRYLSNMAIVCEASGALHYNTKSTLPDPLTLAWWAYGDQRCHGPNLPEGQFILKTCWTVHQPFVVLPEKTVCIDSNPFTIRSDAPQQMQIDGLKYQVETLQKQITERPSE